MQDGSMWSRIAGGQDGDHRLIYLGQHQPAAWAIGLPEDEGVYHVDLSIPGK